MEIGLSVTGPAFSVQYCMFITVGRSDKWIGWREIPLLRDSRVKERIA